MCKNLKIKFIITIIAIMFLALVIPSITNKSLAIKMGTNYNFGGLYSDSKGKNSINWNNFAGEGSYVGSSLFKQDFVFCVQRGQDLHFSTDNVVDLPKYKKSDEIIIDGSHEGVLNGLAYILNQTNSDYSRTKIGAKGNWTASNDWTWYQDDPNQLALWAYLHTYCGNINKALGLINNKEFCFPSTSDAWNGKYGDKNNHGYDLVITNETITR